MRILPPQAFRGLAVGRFGRNWRLAFILLPAGPGAPTWSAQPGPGAGQVSWSITAPPTSLGDGPIAGDGAGVLTGYVTRVGGVEVTHGPALPVSRVVTGLPPVLTLLEVQSIGYGGRRGPVSSAYVTPIAEPESEFAVLIDAVTGAVLIDAVTDRELIDAWPHWPLLGRAESGAWELLRGRTDAGTYETLLGRAA